MKTQWRCTKCGKVEPSVFGHILTYYSDFSCECGGRIIHEEVPSPLQPLPAGTYKAIPVEIVGNQIKWGVLKGEKISEHITEYVFTPNFPQTLNISYLTTMKVEVQGEK
jgi:DNA-directed RNA polymerase subunit RPC12/RpoP